MKLVTPDARRSAPSPRSARPPGGLAALPHPFRLEPDDRHPEEILAEGQTLLHTICDRASADEVNARSRRVRDAPEQRRYFGLELLAKAAAMTRLGQPEVTLDLLPINA